VKATPVAAAPNDRAGDLRGRSSHVRRPTGSRTRICLTNKRVEQWPSGSRTIHTQHIVHRRTTSSAQQRRKRYHARHHAGHEATGWSRAQWLDNITQWAEKGLVDIVRLAEDRNGYRRFVFGAAYARLPGTGKGELLMTIPTPFHVCSDRARMFESNHHHHRLLRKKQHIKYTHIKN